MRKTWTDARVRKAALIAKEFGVSVRLDTDGAVTISPISTKDAEEDELDRELAEFERGFRNPWPGPHLNHRENKVLEKLVKSKGDYLPASVIPFAGPATVMSLLAYGLIEVDGDSKNFERSMRIRATPNGSTFLMRRADHYRKYPSL